MLFGMVLLATWGNDLVQAQQSSGDSRWKQGPSGGGGSWSNPPQRPPGGAGNQYPVAVPTYYNNPYYYGYWPYGYPPPAIYVPAGTLYGPDVTQRFLEGNTAGAGSSRVPSNEITPDQRSLPRVTSGQSLTLATKFIGYGDTHFHNQQYSEAYQRYRKAIEVAPNLADAAFRQGFALLAMGKHDPAAKAIKRGLSLDDGWPKSSFSVNDLYGASSLAKTAHLDALAKAAEDDASNGDLLFLLGVFLYFDGQRQRAAPFFDRAAQLGRGPHIVAFQEQLMK
jgi:tetratricopeptide (TPR) repeat protein